MSRPETVDLEVFSELQETMGDDFANELVSTFLEEVPGMVAALKAAAAAGDADAFRRAAHSLKSNAQVFGAAALGELSRTLELSDLSQIDVEARLTEFDAENTRTTIALKALLNG
jgi:HPt (histidine-containing phosphotransfer) domain-containing protein